MDFGTDTVVTRVCTQGRQNADQWVTSYYVLFSSRGQRFITYKEGRRTKVITYCSIIIIVHRLQRNLCLLEDSNLKHSELAGECSTNV